MASGNNGNSNRSDGKQAEKKGKKTNPNRRHRLYLMNVIMLCLVTLASLAGAFYSLSIRMEAQEEMASLQAELDSIVGDNKTLYTAEEVAAAEEEAREEGAQEERSQILMQIQSDMQSGGSTASMLRSLFSDDIVVVSGGKYYFYPVDDSLAKNTYGSEDFALTEDGRLYYSGSDAVRVQNGIDISAVDGEVDWSAVSEDDITFVMVDAGERLAADSEDGEAGDIVDDEMLAENISGASEAGLGVGVFWTLGAASAEEAEEEAQHYVELLEDSKAGISSYAAVRLNVPSDTDRTAGQGRDDWTEYITIFCRTLEDAGYAPLIYGNLASFVMMLNLDELEEYGWSRWLSNSGSSLYFPYEFTMWQYSTSGAVQGISTEVSLNVLLTQG